MTEREAEAIRAAEEDGWILDPGSVSTFHQYYRKEGQLRREDTLIEQYFVHDKKIFVITCEGLPNTFIKAKTVMGAVEQWRSTGWTEEKSARYVNHPSFQVRELTLELLYQLTPDEFVINTDTSF